VTVVFGAVGYSACLIDLIDKLINPLALLASFSPPDSAVEFFFLALLALSPIARQPLH
jgi:hypothetical protein